MLIKLQELPLSRRGSELSEQAEKAGHQSLRHSPHDEAAVMERAARELQPAGGHHGIAPAATLAESRERHPEACSHLIAEDRVRFVTDRSEEHTSELQSQSNLVCRLLLEKK